MKKEIIKTFDLVLDCSIAMSWCFEDEISDYAENIFNQFNDDGLKAIVPAIWAYEIANVLLVAERKKRLTHLKAIEFKEALNLLDIQIDNEGIQKSSGSIYELAKETQLTIYDAAYLELAVRMNLPLATLDHDLARAIRKLRMNSYNP